MIKVLSFQLVISLVIGCVSKEDDSEPFQEFDAAGELDCNEWLKDENTLGVYDLVQSRIQPVAFVAKVRRRNNEVQFHFREMSGGRLEPEQTRQLFLPSSVRLLGTGSFGNSYLLTINPESGYRLEIRRQPENKIIYSDTADRKHPTYNEVVIGDGKGGFWLVYSVDDEKGLAAIDYYRFTGSIDKPTFEVKSYKKLRLDPSKDLVVGHNGSLAVLYAMEDEGRAWVEYQVYKPGSKASPRVDLQIPVTSKVDKWAAISSRGDIHLAVVDGDSFLRQTNLRVSRLKLDNQVLKPLWLKTRSLMNFHVSTPVWSQNSNDLSILIPKWLDGKSTIARYQIQNGGVIGTGHIGKFPNAAMITSSHTSSADKARYLVVRTKDQIGWSFDVCRME